MRMTRAICMVLVCMLLVGTISVPARAAEIEPITFDYYTVDFAGLVEDTAREVAGLFATGSFSMSIPAKSKATANSSFPLAAGETVTIKASYSPFSASVDFGLVAPDGKYYCVNITDGSIDQTIVVNESGDYTLRIRNNSDTEVEVSGFVNY